MLGEGGVTGHPATPGPAPGTARHMTNVAVRHCQRFVRYPAQSPVRNVSHGLAPFVAPPQRDAASSRPG